MEDLSKMRSLSYNLFFELDMGNYYFRNKDRLRNKAVGKWDEATYSEDEEVLCLMSQILKESDD